MMMICTGTLDLIPRLDLILKLLACMLGTSFITLNRENIYVVGCSPISVADIRRCIMYLL